MESVLLHANDLQKKAHMSSWRILTKQHGKEQEAELAR